MRRTLSLTLAAAFLSARAFAQGAPANGPEIKLSDEAKVQLGGVIQPTYEAMQDQASGGYSQNWYLRRARLSALGTFGDRISVLFVTEDARVGNAGATGVKNETSGFQILDAYAQWALAGKAAAVQAGLFLVPTIRQGLTSCATFLGLDSATWALQQGTVEQATFGRDYGLGVNGSFAGGLSYRVGIFSGYRAPASAASGSSGASAGSRNSPRIAGRVMYDFFEPEAAYLYSGTFLGSKKKVASVAAVGDVQGSYKGFGGDAFLEWPAGPGALTAEADYMRFDGHGFVYVVNGTPTALPAQETLYADAGYYVDRLELQPFARYETLRFSDSADAAKDQKRFGGGLNYYVRGQNFKITAYYERVVPNAAPAAAATKDSNRAVLQFQGAF